jgi:hypothetical protein
MGCAQKKVTTDILFDCLNRPKKGIDSGFAVLINWDDIDLAASIVDGSKINDLVLKAGTSGVKIEWYKDLASANSAFTPSDEDVDGFTHNFLTRLPNSSADAADRANEMAGGRFVMVYETKFKGTDSLDAFKVAGWTYGLTLSEMATDTAANGGAPLYTLSNKADEFEDYPYNVFLETSYAISKATFESLFAQV